MTQSDAFRAQAAMRQMVLGGPDRRREVAEATGVSFGRAKALRRLASLGPMRMSELATYLSWDKPYMTIVADDLEQRGLVTRNVAPDDRRAKVLTITDAGRELAAVADRILAEPAPGLALLDDEEMATLVRLLEKAAVHDDERPD